MIDKKSNIGTGSGEHAQHDPRMLLLILGAYAARDLAEGEENVVMRFGDDGAGVDVAIDHAAGTIDVVGDDGSGFILPLADLYTVLADLLNRPDLPGNQTAA